MRTAAVLAPWACLGVVLVLAALFGVEALNEAARREFAALLEQGGRSFTAKVFLPRVEPYFVTVVAALGGTGILVLVLHRLVGRDTDDTREEGRFLARDGVSATSLVGVLVVGALLVLGHHLLGRFGDRPLPTSRYFPIGVFLPEIHWTGLPYAISFLAVVAWAWGRERGGALLVWILGLALLFLGNLIQGGWYVGFRFPFEGSGLQYLHDAIRIEDASVWLAGFNEAQDGLTVHSTAHPPFAVLVNYWLWKAAGVSGLSLAFVVFTSASIPLFFAIVRELGLSRAAAFRLSLLFAALPAFNVYGAVCLDGVVLTLLTLGLWGLVRIERNRLTAVNLVLLVAGFVGANLLTFGALVFVGVALVVAARRFRADRFDMAYAVVTCVGTSFLLVWGMKRFWGYDHVAAFLTATQVENPGGFWLLHDPFAYFVTRVEGVAEILVFLSIGVLALIVRHRRLRLDRPHPGGGLALVAIVLVMLAFATGAFRTGETARSCLFVYPYLLLLIRNAPRSAWNACLVLAALQTVLMQMSGTFFW